MPLWQWIADTAGVALLLVLCYALALVVRRRYISRNGGTFELSHRARSAPTGRGWVLGLGRYSGQITSSGSGSSPSRRGPAGPGRGPAWPTSGAATPRGTSRCRCTPTT